MGLVLSEEFLGVFVMEKRRESMETHSEGKDGDLRDHQKHNHGDDDDDDDDVDDGRVSQKENGDKGATNHIFWTQGLKVKGGKIALPAETQVREPSLVNLRPPGFDW